MAEWKETLLMPYTAFEMRGNLAKKEPGYQKRWEEGHLYEKMMERSKDRKPFVLHDGPPYANNNLHMGTSMNRCIKDFIVKSHYMNGFHTPFYPGWDTHGLPIENMMPKIGVDRKKMSTAEFRNHCEQYAKKQIEIQKATMKRLGTVADFDHPYITLTKDFEADEVRSFAKMAMKGLIYKGLKPICWSPERESAVADTETYYEDKTDETIYVAFDVVDGKGVLEGDEKFVIWTTTPWTIPGDQAITLNPDLTYALVDTEKGKLIFLENLKDKLCDKFGLEKRDVLRTFKGRELEYITVQHPLYDRTSLVCLADYVTDEDGTGCVHTASGHGLDDFYTCQRYGLPVLCPVDEKGLMTKEAGDFLEGIFVFDANKVVIEKLKELGCLLATEMVTHSYPFDERMKKPIIYRATVQWFASIDKIREELLNEIKNNVKWENDFGEVRMYNMIKDRQDWCISRQRVWGVPIPIIYTEDGQPIFDEAVFEHIANLFEQYGSNVWFERDAKDLLPEGYTNPASPNGLFTKEKDIMDVWFDSGSSFNTLIQRGEQYPCDIYFEGSDQYRGWFNSSLIVSTATYGKAPYKSVLSHGYVLDGKGYQMHKSAGNAVDPQTIISVYGADIIRLWAATSDYRQDVRCSDDLFKHVSETYRKIRNTFRFMLSVTGKTRKNGEPDFDYANDKVPFEKMSKVNKTMEVLLNDLTRKVIDAYMRYDFLGAVSLLSNFLSNEMSSFYLDYTKDVLYIEKVNEPKRRETQTVIYDVLKSCLLLIAPVLSYTAEEIWDYANDNDGTSVFLHDFPEVREYENAEEYRTFFKKLMALRDDALKELELQRASGLIGKSLEAKVLLNLNSDYACLKEDLSAEELADLLIVSELEYAENDGNEYTTGKVKVEKAEGVLCGRCWKVVHEVNEQGICERCGKVVGL